MRKYYPPVPFRGSSSYRLAAIYFEKIPGLEIIARKHILKDSRPLLLLGNEKLQKLLNTKKKL